MTDDRTDGTEGGEADVEERVLGFLRTADRPRVLASDVAAGLDLSRGRVRTRLQSLADEGRVVRTDAEGTARWAVSERADEPDGPESGPPADTEGPNGNPDPVESPSERGGEGDGPNTEGATNAEDATDAPAANAEGTTDAGDSDADRTARTGRSERGDAPTAAPGPSGGPSDRPTTGTSPEPAIDLSTGGGRSRRPGPMVALALIVGLILALAALRRLRRR